MADYSKTKIIICCILSINLTDFISKFSSDSETIKDCSLHTYLTLWFISINLFSRPNVSDTHLNPAYMHRWECMNCICVPLWPTSVCMCFLHQKKPNTPDLNHFTVDEWELPKEEFSLEEELGSGYFATVYQGHWKNHIKVAIKIIKSGIWSSLLIYWSLI